MKKIKTNYIILFALLVITVFLTLFLSNLYISKNKIVSSLYKYSNKITNKEFDEYMTENSDVIIYISNKYNIDNELFEKGFESKLDKLNLKNKLIFIEKNNFNDKFITKLNKEYSMNIDLEKLPAVIVIIEKNVSKIIYVSNNTDVDSFIDYEVFE